MKNKLIGMNIKQKVRTKIQQMNIDIFSNKIWFESLFILVYLNQDASSKRFKNRMYYLSKCKIRNHNAIINGKNFFYQPIDSDMKQ